MEFKKVLTNTDFDLGLRIRLVKCYVWTVLLYGVYRRVLRIDNWGEERNQQEEDVMVPQRYAVDRTKDNGRTNVYHKDEWTNMIANIH